MNSAGVKAMTFLSIQAQDFIEDQQPTFGWVKGYEIPEHSSSGLH